MHSSRQGIIMGKLNKSHLGSLGAFIHISAYSGLSRNYSGILRHNQNPM